MTRISIKDFYIAKYIYAEILPTLPTHIQFFLPSNFENFVIGASTVHEYYHGMDATIIIGDMSFRKMKMLLSPHAATLLRAWVIKHNSFTTLLEPS